MVAEAAKLAAARSPLRGLAGEVLIGTREMRTLGIEAAYAVRDSHARRPGQRLERRGKPTELRRTAERVARTWTW